MEALLDRCHGEVAAARSIVDTLEHLGYRSWAHRVVSSAGVYVCSVSGFKISSAIMKLLIKNSTL